MESAENPIKSRQKRYIKMGLINVDVAAKSSAKESKLLTQFQAYLISLIKKGDY